MYREYLGVLYLNKKKNYPKTSACGTFNLRDKHIYIIYFCLDHGEKIRIHPRCLKCNVLLPKYTIRKNRECVTCRAEDREVINEKI